MSRLVGEWGRVLEGTAAPAVSESVENAVLLSGAVEAIREAAGEGGGSPVRVVEVTIIRPGDSNNRHRYRQGECVLDNR